MTSKSEDAHKANAQFGTDSTPMPPPDLPADALAILLSDGRAYAISDAVDAEHVAAENAHVGVSQAYDERYRDPTSAQAWADAVPEHQHWQSLFLDALRAGQDHHAAARAAHISLITVYKEQKRNPAFAQALLDSKQAFNITWQPVLLAELRAGRGLRAAIQAVGVSKARVLRERKRDPAFDQAVIAAQATSATSELPSWAAAFFHALQAGMSTRDAARTAGVDSNRCNRERQQNPVFAQAWEAALAEAVEAGNRRDDRNWTARVLDALRAGKTVREAADAAGVHFRRCHRERKRNPVFAQAWEAALAEATPAWQALFLEALRAGNAPADAAKAAGVAWESVLAARNRDPAFAHAWVTAQLVGMDTGNIYQACKHDPAFAQEWAEAQASAQRPAMASTTDAHPERPGKPEEAAPPQPPAAPRWKLAPELLHAIQERYHYGESPSAIAAALSLNLDAVIQAAADLPPLPAPRPLGPDAATRFWQQADQSGGPRACWVWQGRQEKGWGRFWSSGIYHQAQRVAYTLTFGDVPPRHRVLQECGNRLCVNPDHIFLERIVPPPSIRGEAHGQAKLSDQEVVEIRLRYAAGGITLQALADVYGVHESTIRKLVRGQRRSDAPGPTISPRPANTPSTHTAASVAPPAAAPVVTPVELPDAARRGDRYHLTWGTGQTLCGRPCSTAKATPDLTFAPHRDCQRCTYRARMLALRCPACGQILQQITADGRCSACLRASR